LANIGIAHASDSLKFAARQSVEKLDLSAQRLPEPERIRHESLLALVTLDPVAEELAKRSSGSHVEPRKLLRLLCASSCGDIDAARQVAWAFESVYAELRALAPQDKQVKLMDSELSSFRALKGEPRLLGELIGRYDEEEFRKRLGRLDSMLASSSKH
jgi:hypothetical protein